MFFLRHSVYRWNFVQAMSNNDVNWSEFVNILDIQFHESLFIIDNDGSMSGSVAACIFAKLCTSLCCYSLLFLFFSE